MLVCLLMWLWNWLLMVDLKSGWFVIVCESDMSFCGMKMMNRMNSMLVMSCYWLMYDESMFFVVMKMFVLSIGL